VFNPAHELLCAPACQDKRESRGYGDDGEFHGNTQKAS
jgi:hypothetical protein